MSALDLQEIRGQLDQVDRQLVALFEERMRLSGQVALYKRETGKPIYDGERERQKLDGVTRMAHGEFNQQGARELLMQLMNLSRRFQHMALAKEGPVADWGFQPVESLDLLGARVVYQGVEGAYSHKAAIQYFGQEVDAYHVPSWDEAMRDVEEGRADYGVFPMENSSAGAVLDNYDLLLKYKTYMVGELFLPVRHSLLGVPGARLESVKTVLSHPQALLQCSEYLDSHSLWRKVAVENTAVAAKKVMEDQDRSQAAVASPEAASLYGMEVLKPSISNRQQNTTRFVLLSNQPVYQKAARKVSICFELPHKAGSLYHMLGHFIYNQVNLVMIESRPIPEKDWEYRFFVDLEGNLKDPALGNALKGVFLEAPSMRILGNY